MYHGNLLSFPFCGNEGWAGGIYNIRTSLSMPRNAVTKPVSGTYWQNCHLIWNELSDSVVGERYKYGGQSFKSRVHHHLIPTVAEGSMTFFLTAVNH